MYSIQAPDGKTYQIEGPGGASDDQVRAAVLEQHPDAGKPAKFGEAKEPPGAIAKGARAAGEFLSGYGEAGLKLTSGVVAPVAGGLAGIAQGGANIASEAMGKQPEMSAAERVEKVTGNLTYEPKSQGANEYVDTITKPLQLLAKGADAAGGKVTDATGSPALGAAVNTGIQMLPALVDPALRAGKAYIKPGAAAEGAEAAKPTADTAKAKATGRAQAYADHIGLDWNKLSGAFKKKLTELAASAKGFEGLKPEQIKRQALFSEVGIENPTKGQVTRDTDQRGAEAAVKQTGAGKELRDLDEEHNRVLLGNVEKLRAKVAGENIKTDAGVPSPTRSQNTGDLPVGRQVQDAAVRQKAATSKKNYDRLYRKARETEPEATVPADDLYGLLEQNPHIQHLGWVASWLKRAKVETASLESVADSVLGPSESGAKAAPTRRGLKLNEIQDLRQDANAISRGGGTDAHYAAQVRDAIDKVMETVPESAKAWKEANAAFKAHAQEFKNQSAVRGLAEDKPQSSDRRVAIEETARKTVTGRLEDLQKVKRTLLTGADAASRTAGKIAWRDLKGWGLDYIRQRMTKGPVNAAGDPHTTWVGLKRALDDIGNENLDELYGRTTRNQLRRYAEAAENLWTEPSTRIAGSPTFEKILRFLDRIGGIPIVGKGAEVTAGAIKGVGKLGEIGQAGREVRSATQTPVDEQLSTARRTVKQQQRRRTYQAGAPLAGPAEEQRGEQ